MGHQAEHHIEHAEHAAHASRDEFDKQVTISIAIVAAVLAAVTLLGHRAHNETLQAQGAALQERNDASNHHIESSDLWNLYQAQNIRKHQYSQSLGLLEVVAVDKSEEAAAKQKKLHKYWQNQVDKYEEQLTGFKKKAEEEKEIAKEHEKKSQELVAEMHAIHARATRFDLGELGLQLGVVVCSLSILTKRRPFWVIGLLCSAAGLAVAATGYFGLFMNSGHH
jgi:uncharacterized protein DUF4337